MIRTGDAYRESLRDGREVYMDGVRVDDVTTHPQFKPLIDIKARVYDMQHEAKTQNILSFEKNAERFSIGNKMPYQKSDWQAKRKAVETIMYDIGGVVTRIGDETIGEMWSLADGADILNEIDQRFSANIKHHIELAVETDPFHVSANTDPKGDRSLHPEDQDPDMLTHVVKETDAGLIIRGAKYETASAYSNQAFLKPTISNWGNDSLSSYALGCIVKMNAPGVKHICRSGFSGMHRKEDYPLSNKFDEIDSLMILDNVLIPWEDVLFYQHTKAAAFIRATLHRYSAFAFIQRLITYADMMIGTALLNVKQTGLEKQQAVQEKLAQLAVYREGINAHLIASIELGEKSPAGFLMPNQSLLMTGRVHACSQLPAMMHLTRELCGGQICVTPNVSAFESDETGEWLKKYYSINAQWQSEDRRKLLAFGRDLLNSSYAGHRLTFHLFAQSPPFAHLGAVYRNFDWKNALDFVKKSADLSQQIETP
ncbi:MAG: 4-hydroxyphenylacetate 3-hydroxylase family protein [Pseudomonadota bacterium]